MSRDFKENMEINQRCNPEPKVNPEKRLLLAINQFLAETPNRKSAEILYLRMGFKDSRTYTLEELGEKFNVTRERIRQIESKAWNSLKQSIENPIKSKIYSILERQNHIAAIAALEEDTYFEGITSNISLLDYLLKKCFKKDIFWTMVEDKHYLITYPEKDFLNLKSIIMKTISTTEYPIKFSFFIGKLALKLNSHNVSTYFIKKFLKIFAPKLKMSGDGVVYGKVGALEASVLHVLSESPNPLHYREVYESVKHSLESSSSKKEVALRRIQSILNSGSNWLLYQSGTYGLEKHFPQIESFFELLIPLCIELIQESGEERQWSSFELHEELKEKHNLQKWFTPYHLNILLKKSEYFVCHGRQVFSLANESKDDSQRLHIYKLARSILFKNGGPLKIDELFEKIREERSATQLTFQLLFNRNDFVKLDKNLIGLADRDLSGTKNEHMGIVKHARQILLTRQQGIEISGLLTAILQMSIVSFSINIYSLRYILRQSGQFNFSNVGRAVGLKEWGNTRFVSMKQVLEKALEAMPGEFWSRDFVLKVRELSEQYIDEKKAYEFLRWYREDVERFAGKWKKVSIEE